MARRPRSGLAEPIVIDMTGGVFNGAFSTTPAQILVIDSDDPKNPRADVPGFGDAIWAGLADAEVDCDLVDVAFDDSVWIDRDKAKDSADEMHAKARNPSDAANGTLRPEGPDAPAGAPWKVLAESISDVEAVSIETVMQEWPDLAATCAKARACAGTIAKVNFSTDKKQPMIRQFVPAGAAPRKGRAGRQAAPLPGAAPAAPRGGDCNKTAKQEAPMGTHWDENKVRALRGLWAEGHSTAEIGRRLRVSKNAIVGKAHRLDLDARPSPVRRDGRTSERPAAAALPAAKAAEIRRPAAASAAPAKPATRPEPKPALPVAVQRLAPPERLPEPCRPLRSWTAAACCWPIGEPGTRTFRFCDDRALAGKPYCEEHAKLAYRPKPALIDRERADERQANSVM